jgi:hypothetical protein
MARASRRRIVATLILSTACTAGSVAFPPSESISACPATRAEPRASRQPRPVGPIPATTWSKKTDSYSLVSVDPLSFEERGPALSIGTQRQGWHRASSSDGRRLAVGGDGKTIEIIDLQRRRIIATIEVGQAQTFLAWPNPDRITAVTGAASVGKLKSAVIIDVNEGAVVARQELSGEFVNAAASEDVLAVLTAPARPESSRRVTDLTVLLASGVAMTVRLDGIGSGYRFPSDEAQSRIGHYALPGLAIDRKGNRVFVFGVDRLVAEVSLGGGTVSYRRLGGPSSSLALDAAEAKLANYSQLFARSLPNGLIAVFGHDQRLVPRGRHHLDHRFDPFGVVLFDPEDGRACVLHDRADSALIAAEALIVFTSIASGPDGGTGVTAFTMNGKELWHRFGDDAIDFVQVQNGYAYITKSWHGWETAVVELSTGRLIAAIRGRPADLAGAQSSRPGVNGLY